MSAEEKDPKSEEMLLFPALSGGGVLARRGELVGGRPNGHEGSVLYLRSGPSIYTSLTTPELARVFGAQVIEKR